MGINRGVPTTRVSAMSDAAMISALRTFLAEFGRPRICYDFGVDRELCQRALDGAYVSVVEDLGSDPVRRKRCCAMCLPQSASFPGN